MGSQQGFSTIFILTLISAVVCNEELIWDTPCIYQRPGQCNQQMQNGETLRCDILDEGSRCESLLEYVSWLVIPDKPEILDTVTETAIAFNPASNETEEHLMAVVEWKQDTRTNRENLKGFHVSMRGLTNHGDYEYDYFGEERCFTFNITDNDFVELGVGNLYFEFDCFRPLSPYCEYQIVVRTMATNNEAGEDDITEFYTTTSYRLKTPSCGDQRISHTAECQVTPGEEPAHWKPQYLLAYSPTYYQIGVKFDLPPQSYGFDKYDITVYYYTPATGSCSGYVDAARDVTKSDENVRLYNETRGGRNFTVMEYTFPYDEYEPDTYCMKVKPDPTKETCQKGGSTVSCITTTSNDFLVLDDPCRLDPCGDNGNCTGLHEEYHYVCDCNPGYKAYPPVNQTCQADPCYFDPCGDIKAGNCTPILNTTNYICNCSYNHYLEDDTCKEDFCYGNPCVNGVCYIADGRYRCNCTKGYTYSHEEGKCLQEPGNSKTGIIAASITGAAFAIVLVICFYVYYRQKTQPPSVLLVPGPPGPHPEKAQGILNPKILLLYTKDCDLHVKVVDHFARFLRNQLYCEVKHDEWEVDSVAADKTDWILTQMQEVDKIIVIATEGTRNQTLLQSQESYPNDQYTDGLFTAAMMIIRNNFQDPNSLMRKKCVNIHFSVENYSTEEKIPELVKIIGKTFNLPEQFDRFYLYLRNLSYGGPGGYKHVKGLDEMLDNSDEGKALYEAIDNMRNYVSNKPDWYSLESTITENGRLPTEQAYTNGGYEINQEESIPNDRTFHYVNHDRSDPEGIELDKIHPYEQPATTIKQYPRNLGDNPEYEDTGYYSKTSSGTNQDNGGGDSPASYNSSRPFVPVDSNLTYVDPDTTSQTSSESISTFALNANLRSSEYPMSSINPDSGFPQSSSINHGYENPNPDSGSCNNPASVVREVNLTDTYVNEIAFV